MPFYPADWLSSSSVALMSLAEQGAFFRLLCHAWDDPDCCLPDDDAALAQLSGLGDAWQTGSGARLRARFVADPERKGKIYNEKQRRLRTEQQERQSHASARGRKGAQKRWSRKSASSSPADVLEQCPSNAGACPEHMPGDASSPVSPLPSPVSQREREGGGDTLIEPAGGFPKTETEASSHAAAIGCPEEFARRIWKEAAARGGKDSKGKPVVHWHRYLAGRFAFEQARTTGPRTANNSLFKPDHSKGF